MMLKKSKLISVLYFSLVTVSTAVSTRSAQHHANKQIIKRQVEVEDDGLKLFIKNLFPDIVKVIFFSIVIFFELVIIITHFRFQTDKLRQISNDEFYKLFNNKQIVTQDQNQQFPSEILFPESIQSPDGQNSFLLRAGDPQIFLFDEEV